MADLPRHDHGLTSAIAGKGIRPTGLGLPADIVYAALYLASDESPSRGVFRCGIARR